MTILKMFVLYLISIVILLPIISLENFVLYEVTAFNPHERELLYYLHVTKHSIVFMNGVSNQAAIPMDVLVKNDSVQFFESKLESYGIYYCLYSYIPEIQLLSKKKKLSNNITEAFCDWESILTWTDSLEQRFNIKIKKTVIAKTYEKRDIFFLKISKGQKKPIVFIVGGEDGKDWMSSSLVLNLVYEFVEGNIMLQKLLNIFDFYLLPLLNPDGFVYTKNKDRLWRKNRKERFPKKQCNGNYAIGVNIGRNWFTQRTTKFGDEECNSIYTGHRSLSEEESQSLSYVLNSLSQNMIAFIDVRGFGRYITIPYGHTSTYSNNYDIVEEILRYSTAKVREMHNVSYYVAPTSSIFYNFSGNMADWVKQKLNTPIVYTIYLEEPTTVLPLSKHIKELKKHFIQILSESLPLFHDIYGPLFKSQVINLSFHFKYKCLLLHIILDYLQKINFINNYNVAII